MALVPEFNFNFWHGAALLALLLLARYGVPLLVNPAALRRLNVTPPVEDAQLVVPVYVVNEGLLVLYPFFLTIKTGTPWVVAGAPLMVAGAVLVALAALEFARQDGFLHRGIYRYSRNPMYVGYFLYFVGVGLVTASWLYLLLAITHQVALYKLIGGEERWCLAEYGEPYRRYTQQVRRYAGRRGE